MKRKDTLVHRTKKKSSYRKYGRMVPGGESSGGREDSNSRLLCQQG